nr:MAG TPA: hypothetical protein [Caudoviricetes sp.]
MSKSYDLSTSTKWANLADGEHTIKLRAKGAGYGTSSFSNSVTVTKGNAMPAKGDLITIESKQYRVLKVNGSVAEVLAMYDASSSQKFGSNNTYEGSALDTYCNSTFYGTLSSAMKTAIVEKTFAQDQWSYASGDSGGTGTAIYQGINNDSSKYRVGLITASYGANITRKCYALSAQDLVDYLDVTTEMTSSNTTLTSKNIYIMIWNITTKPENFRLVWMRSASYAGNSYAHYISSISGSFSSSDVDGSYAVRPAFQIDLSKIEWSPVGGVTLINFTIAGAAYQAEEGMTWAQWVNSSYNTGGFSADSFKITVPSTGSPGGYIFVGYNNEYESPQNIIVPDRSYVLLTAGQGN